MDPRPHASIGEVLGELQSEFPDITISKIRFLESQGLINPERTPSGYRKFYEGDVARVRWILLQQQQNFLPLKVIKERLAELDAQGVVPGTEPEPVGDAVETAQPTTRSRKKSGDAPAKTTARRRKPRVEMPELPLDDGTRDDLAPEPSGASLNRAELARAAGITEQQIAELEAYGLLTPLGQVGEHVLFDEEAFVIASSAAGFFKRGIEARHLRMYRSFAEREAALFQQVVLPMLRARNPEARRAAHEEIGEMAKLGRALRAVYLRTAVAELIDE
jgi:DNA-binding transcriptional MerR regulator